MPRPREWNVLSFLIFRASHCFSSPTRDRHGEFALRVLYSRFRTWIHCRIWSCETAWAARPIGIGPIFPAVNKHPRPKFVLSPEIRASRLLRDHIYLFGNLSFHRPGVRCHRFTLHLSLNSVWTSFPTMTHTATWEAQGLESFILDFLDQTFQENLSG